jgi:oligosaccharyltransferase complex subunit beta
MGLRGLFIWTLICTLVLPLLALESRNRVLVLLEDMQIRNTHSTFFGALERAGYHLDYREAMEPELELSKYGEYLYDNLIIFAPQVDAFAESLSVDSILNFIDDGNNVLIAGDSQVSDALREIALECGIEFGESDAVVIDHLNFDVSDVDGDHTLIVSDSLIKAPIITGEPKGPILYRGTGLLLEDNNQLLIPILRGSSTSYVLSPDESVNEEPKIRGSKTVLVAALQARNNARVTFSGSLEFFSDKFFNSAVQKYQADGADLANRHPKSGNEQLAITLAKWTFGERGVLRATNIRHHRRGETQAPRIYTVKEHVEYYVDVEEWDGVNKKWVAYNATDIPIEFVRLDPHERIYLKQVGNTATYHAALQVPDVYGVFTFRLKYQRLGYTSFSDNTKVTVRPLRHNQYERFIFSAYPYYASAFSMMFGLFLFSLFFLYHKDTPAKTGKNPQSQ